MDKANRWIAIAAVIVLITGAAYGFLQYSQQKNDLSSALFSFGKWRLVDAAGDGITISVEYAVENPAQAEINLPDFDLIVSYKENKGTVAVQAFSIEPGRKIERTLRVTIRGMNAEDFLGFLAESDVQISGTAHLRVLFFEIPVPFAYDVKNRKMVFA